MNAREVCASAKLGAKSSALVAAAGNGFQNKWTDHAPRECARVSEVNDVGRYLQHGIGFGPSTPLT